MCSMVLGCCIFVKMLYQLQEITDWQIWQAHLVSLCYTSLWASNSEESKQMRKVAPAGVFSFKDRHSDELCYQTVSEDLEKILQETKDVLTTLVPEQYRTFTAEAKTLSLLGRPLYITTNANGDFLFTGRKFVCGLRYSI